MTEVMLYSTNNYFRFGPLPLGLKVPSWYPKSTRKRMVSLLL